MWVLFSGVDNMLMQAQSVEIPDSFTLLSLIDGFPENIILLIIVAGVAGLTLFTAYRIVTNRVSVN
jgi:hypothetical protein